MNNAYHVFKKKKKKYWSGVIIDKYTLVINIDKAYASMAYYRLID